jgi:microcystin-dependent protein
MSIAQNTALFSILGTTFGGNGQTTFGLPDLRGRAPVGAGDGPGLTPISLGEMAGNENATLTTGNMPMHTHAATVTINAANNTRGGGSSDSPSGGVLDNTGNPNTKIYGSAPDGTKMSSAAATATIGNSGGSQPFSIQSPYLGVNFIIALQGVFPTRN